MPPLFALRKAEARIFLGMVDCDSASHPFPSLHEGISSLFLSSPLSLPASLSLLLSICHPLLLADIRLRPVFDNLAKITLSLNVSRILYSFFFISDTT